ncbi:MAG: heme ABC transporter permease [Proteobacteria bacterium]|nr:heme ABC transporter permease [Pseudomonadota bacterium]
MWNWLHQLASPPCFNRFVAMLLPWLAAAWLTTFMIGLWWSLVKAPADYQQGEGYRIIFIHVPAAWLSLFIYVVMASVAAIGLVWKFKLAPVFTAASAPLGAAFTALTLVTGSVWGKPMWGTWWVWDARLTSELILLFLYLGYIALQNTISDVRSRNQAGAILLIVGVVNIPIIHYSVEWWNTLHQPASIMKFDSPSVHPQMLYPLLLMAISFKLFYGTALLLAMQCILWQRQRGGNEYA